MSYIIDQWNKGEVAIDDNVLGWKMKDGEFRPLMSDALNELFYEGYINWGMVDDTNRARKVHEAKVLEEYREARANRTREQKREEQFELQAAFGPGAKVVNIFTGETTDVPAAVEVESDELNQTGGWSDDTLAMMGKSIIKQAKAKTSKKARVAQIIEAWNKDPFYVVTLHRAELIDEIVAELGVTKANAGVYVYNYKKARGL